MSLKQKQLFYVKFRKKEVNMIDEIRKYFLNTSKEQFEKDWKSVERYSDVGPLAETMVSELETYFKKMISSEKLKKPERIKTASNSLDSEFSESFFLLKFTT